jgi:hypothetical protein
MDVSRPSRWAIRSGVPEWFYLFRSDVSFQLAPHSEAIPLDVARCERDAPP